MYFFKFCFNFLLIYLVEWFEYYFEFLQISLTLSENLLITHALEFVFMLGVDCVNQDFML